MTEVSVLDVLKEIEHTTKFKFLFNRSHIDVNRKVSINVNKKPVDTILKEIFKSTPVEFEVYARQIILKRSTPSVKSPVPDPATFNALPQLTISGTVTDANQVPLAGANILEKGTSNGVIADFDGNYEIKINDPDNAVLVFSFVGFSSQEVPVNNQTSVHVTLLEDLAQLDEVVVVGFGTQRKKDLTGAVVSANIEDFKQAPNTNVMQSMQGTVPGLNIGQVTSAGSTPSIEIRGTNTISGNSNVLIVLDGIQYNGSLSSINPNDIASVDVLKDASSTAVYGAQAANGVILITTKRGEKGRKPQISFSTSYATQTPTVDLRPLNRQEYIDHVRDLFWDQSYLNDGTLNPDYDITNGFAPVFFDGNGNLKDNNFDWWNAGTNEGFISKNELSVTGGGENFSYLISGGLTSQEGFIIGDKFKRKSLRVNLESQVTPWLKLGIQSFGSFINQDGAEPNIRNLMIQSPLLLPYDENGELVINPFNTLDVNPFTSSDVDDYERHDYFFANIYSEIDLPFIEGLTYRFNYGQNYRLDKHYQSSIYGAGLTGEAYKNNTEYYDYTFDNILTYNKNINEDHSLTATLLYGVIERQSSTTNARANGFSRLSLSYNSLELGENQFTVSDAWDEALEYQMARINYKLKNRYLLTATLRRDGFSGFAKKEKYGLFPSVALGWIISDEFKMPDGISLLKLRGGYGISGNQTGRYSSLSAITTSNAYIFGDDGTTLIGQEVGTLGNSDLKWEKTAGINIGLDFNFFNGRINGSMEYYNNKTKDLLFSVVLPRLSGFDRITSNVGELENSGFELLLTTQNVNSQHFKWSSTLTFSTNRNKVVSLLGVDNDGDGREDDLTASGLFIGQPLGAIYNYEIDGIYQLNDDIPSGYYPGTYRIVDQNPGDSDAYDINPTDDRVILGRREPAYRTGLLNKFEYKGLSLSVFLNTIQGGKNGYLGDNSHATSRGTNTLIWNRISAIDYWTPGNPDGEYPQSVSTPSITPNPYYDRSFVRLQDVSLSYRFPEKLLEKIKVADLNIFISGKNLHTWTKWKGWDPEANVTDNGNVTAYGLGMIVNGRPVMKGYTLGLNITF
ncbi:SusC/RagA family TonB-linked outer membrane protein [Sinomicrobium pectinilyticum]|uniref:SusC/RagA family TonB-linked outer membrane protein n=2 Tax=Sinomicrobium pectinilyticum TaxID=1084421 RepID=A0A3N0E3I5_SINP1|nr:SusC/RagA family TonB-linked outer membrane protein [Sinomicrobium pectinilyticum]